MKILTIVGARPQFIKAAAVSRAFTGREGIDEVLVHTGQHFDDNMSSIFFEQLGIPRPDHHLEIHSLSHGAMTGRMLEEIEKVVLSEEPDCVMVYGDTNSTLAGALAARKLHVDVVHVEAGLRSFDMAMPEEVNRILTDRISNVLYCPTDTAVSNLESEGFENYDCRIVQCGDVMEDAALYYADQARECSTVLDDQGLATGEFHLCTLHRAENTDDPDRLQELVAGLNALSRKYTIVLPLHPRTRIALEKQGLSLDARLIQPVGYLDMIALLDGASVVLTDSGGLQKEAYFFNKYCVTMRDQTEWVETVEHGFNVLVGADREKLVAAVDQASGKPFVRNVELYGGGRAAERIADDLIAHV